MEHNHYDHYDNSSQRPHLYVVLAILALSVIGMVYLFSKPSQAGVIKATVKEILFEKETILEVGDKDRIVKEQKILVEVTSPAGNTGKVEVFNDFMPVSAGDEIFVQGTLFGEDELTVIDISRTRELMGLAIFFVILVFLTSGGKGLYSLVGLLFSFYIIFSFIVPQILQGSDPVLIGVIGSAVILAPTLYLSYGVSKKSIAAFLGIILALLFSGMLAEVTVTAAQFSGLSEAALYLNIEAANPIDFTGLLIAGIIIAAVGVLDDVATVQSSTVFTLASVDPHMRGVHLFKKAMTVGKDHISAVVNTLVLAYTGASLPLVLLFSLREIPSSYFVSMEVVTEEIIRTLVASSGLLLAVPLTTIIATIMINHFNVKTA